MEALFLKLVNLSISASWLVLAVLLLRLIFRKAPRWVFCLLWSLVALRLAFPFSLESALSLIPSAETFPPDIIYTAAPTIESGIAPIDNVVNPILEANLTPVPAASANPTQIWSFLLSRLWCVGVVLMLLYCAVSFFLLKRRVATATLLRENIKQSERVDSPFVLGLFRPTIYLPYSMGDGDMGYVIAHECAHIRRGDHWWKPIGFLILAVYWFNPLMWLAYVLFCRDMELACDEKVVADMDKEARRAYSTALLHCSARRRPIAACPLAFGEVGVKDRVKSVMHYKKPAFWIVLLALLACIAAAVCFLTVPEQPEDTDQPPEVTADTPSPDASDVPSEPPGEVDATPDGSEPPTELAPSIPAPQGGVDPYADLEPAERAAAFLENAETMSYESTLLMYGEYIMITMEYKPRTEQITDPNSGSTLTYTFDHTHLILESLQEIDLSALRQLELAEIESFDIQVSSSGLIHVGDARCRAAVWYDQQPSLEQEYTAALVFTFSDGTMCAFEERILGAGVDFAAADLAYAINIAGNARSYALFPQGGDVAVVQLSTGKIGGTSAYGAALITSIFKNTLRLASSVKNHNGQFDYQVTLADGSVYLFDDENLLLQTASGQVYPIGGFEESEGAWTMEKLICDLITGGFDES